MGRSLVLDESLGMINCIYTSLPSTASLLSLGGRMWSKGDVWFLGWAGCSTAGSEPQLLLPLSSSAVILALVPIVCLQCLWKIIFQTPQEGTARETGARKGGTWELPAPVCSCLALGRWAISHNIWRKSGEFWHPAHRGTGTELLQCWFSKHQALKPLISASFCVVSTGPGKATTALKLRQILLRQRAAEAELSKEFFWNTKEKIRNIFVSGKKICW